MTAVPSIQGLHAQTRPPERRNRQTQVLELGGWFSLSQRVSQQLAHLAELAEIIFQIAFRIFFVMSNVLMGSALFPLTWHWLTLPMIALGSSSLAAFFFPHTRLLAECWQRMEIGQSLHRPGLRRQWPQNYPDESPVGYTNRTVADCAFNATAHLFDSNPQLSQWFRRSFGEGMSDQDFCAFLEGYDFPRGVIAAQFRAFLNDLPAEDRELPIQNLFSRFLDQPEWRDSQIKAIFDAHAVLRQFYLQNDQAVAQRTSVSSGNSNTLRVALSRVNALIDHENVQTSADYIGTAVLDYMMPRSMRASLEKTVVFDLALVPPMRDPVPPVSEIVGLIPLGIDRDDPHPQLEGLIDRTFNCSQGIEDRVYEDINGVPRPYRVLREETRFVESPPALHFWIKRFTYERAPTGWYNQILTYMYEKFPKFSKMCFQNPIGYREIKIDTPVECPQEIRVPMRNGTHCRYRLASFVTHTGGDNRGHYTSGEIRAGRKFIENDASVTLVENQAHRRDWNDQLSQAYLLCYLKVEDPVQRA